jgi:hypothetical protein
MAVPISGGSSATNVANVTGFNLNVTLPTSAAESGFARVACESDSGTVTGAALILAPETDLDYRVRVGVDSPLDYEIFNNANQNTAKHFYNATTMTMALSGGALTTNATSITTLSTGALFRTWRYFPILGQQTPIYTETVASFTAALATNTTIDWGLFIPGAANPYAPADGVYFRATSAGLTGVVNFNGVETPTSVFAFSPTINRVYQFLITLTDRSAQFWIDDVLYGSIEVPTGNGQPMMASAAPWAVRHAIGGVAAGSVLQFKVWDYSVALGSVLIAKPYGHQAAAMGLTMQVQQGATTGGQLSVYALGAAPAAVTLTASTAPATNNAGGLFLLPAAVTAGESDYPLFAYLNPAGTVAIPGRTMVVTGIRINEMFVTTLLVGGPMAFCYAAGFGSTASSLATGESASFGANTTKIARKIALGTIGFAAAAAAGTVAQGFSIDLSESPICVDPGHYFHIILRCIGTNLTAGAIRGGVTIIHHFE